MYSFDEVKNVDPEIAQAIVDEQNRQICGRVPGKKILWRLRMCGCGGKSGDREGKRVVRL